jgi:hypothetical protein
MGDQDGILSDYDTAEHALCSEALRRASDETAMLRGEIGRLKKCIESGQAAYNEERVARDWLARRKAALEESLAYALRIIDYELPPQPDPKGDEGEMCSQHYRFEGLRMARALLDKSEESKGHEHK